MIHDQILHALESEHPPSDRSWIELEEMARSAPETAVDLIVELSETRLEPFQRGWLAAGPLRSAIASSTAAEENELESRAENDSRFAAMLDALVRYERKQRVAISLLEGAESAVPVSREADPQIIIPNVHERSPDQPISEDAWEKVVKAVDGAPESGLFMLASTVLETLLLQNETTFRKELIAHAKSDGKFRRALSYCDLSFSEPFLDDLIDALG